MTNTGDGIPQAQGDDDGLPSAPVPVLDEQLDVRPDEGGGKA